MQGSMYETHMSMSNTIGMNNNSDKERVREAVDLVALIHDFVPLQQSGAEWIGVCPFHDDHKPSMHVVTHKDQAFYKCFSCGAYGDCFKFIEQYLKKSFVEALHFLAEREGIELSGRVSDEGSSTRTKMTRAMNWVSSLYVEAMRSTPEGANALEQLHARGFTDESIEKFSIGVAPDSWTFLTDMLQNNKNRIEFAIEAGLLKRNEEKNRTYDTFRHRIMFPIHDESNTTIAFGGRRLREEDEPKYINSPETVLFNKSKTLYGYKHASPAIRELKKVIVVEGYTDVIACHQSGITNVVATLGTSLTSQHAEKLSRLCNEVVLVFDGDNAGQLAADRAIDVFFRKNIDVQICVLPEGKDPADLAKNASEFNTCVSNAIDALTFKFNRLDSSLQNETTIAGKSNVIESFLNEMARLGIEHLSSTRKPFVYERISSLLNMPMKDVSKELQSRRPAKAKQQQTQEDPTVQSGTIGTISRARQLAEQEFLSILLFNPTESSAALRESNTTITADDFIDPTSAAIAAYIFPKLKAGTLFAMNDLIADIDDNSSNVATTLYFVGQRISETYESVSLALQMTRNALVNAIEKQAILNEIKNVRNESNSEKKTLAAERAIETIRRQQSTGQSP
ncbi:MAG: DNA primase [Planctomycetes bacterium]|nr:DNA primase [Planctomycetota bacterium]